MKIPLLLVLGKRDKLVGDPEKNRALVRDIPNIRVEVLDTGHLIGAEQPEQVNKLIIEFFEDQEETYEEDCMQTSNLGFPSNRLPITRSLTLAYAFSLVIAFIMTIASAVGLLYQTLIYPTDELLLSFVPNDVVNLAIGLPILLGSMWLARRGKLIGLLFWPGALFYILYIYIAYLFGMPFNVLFLPYLTLVTLSAYTMIGLITSVDGEVVHKRLTGVVPAKTAGGILAGLAILFILRVVGIIVPALTNQTPTTPVELSLLVADFVIAPAWFIGGVLLWRRKTFGYVAGTGLLFQSSMLYIALVFFLILQPLITASPFNVPDLVVVFIMGMVCFIPFALFVRGAASERGSSPA